MVLSGAGSSIASASFRRLACLCFDPDEEARGLSEQRKSMRANITTCMQELAGQVLERRVLEIESLEDSY